jgi:hypothetical protein
MRWLCLLLATQLSGCFAFFIPGSVIDKVVGNPAYCVASGSVVGGRFTMNGREWEITRVAGESPYVCRNMPAGMQLGVDAKPV